MDCQEVIKKSVSNGDAVVPELEAQEICRSFSISCPPATLVADREQCLTEAQNMGYPVVIKIFSREIIHKSDVGGVITGIYNPEQLKKAFEQLMDNAKKHAPKAEIAGVIVQKQMPKGVEVVVGGLKNDQFGPVVMFGLGGIYVEVFKDVSFRLVPLDKEEAFRLVKETKVYKLLQGARGEKPCNIEALCEVIVNTGRLLAAFPEIKELDFNPVFCYPDSCTVVDARLVLK
ncbi:acetate--CoA ligase family protein [Sporomusa sp.]|uniref:acetate--CoA ligase family protein n=1 Tax=Sporomusa sp. TaxID=2078658 RepID=UPI002B5BE8E2|nr:acetate--CoA ligase family protein [Sporomusa sp.]HWR09468.1 acetate--CoA ligase family protein [Sporomusa sp.]